MLRVLPSASRPGAAAPGGNVRAPASSRVTLGSSPDGGLSRSVAPGPRLPIRLRTLLGLGITAAAAVWTWPRAEAAFRLHTSASTLADYSLCMVGPTGPSLVRDNPSEFRALVRRRLMAAGAQERPFASCAAAARVVTGSIEVERAHREMAWSFVEFGGDAADRAAAGAREPTLGDLEVGTRMLAALAARAWPFVREGYTTLVHPSVTAKEAVHPVDLPRPAIGSGFPAWRSQYRSVWHEGSRDLLALGHGANLAVLASSDGGVVWKPTTAREPGVAEHAERCVAGKKGGSFTFAISDDGRATVVTSLGPDVEPHGAVLGDAGLRIVAAGCDETGLVAGLLGERSREVGARLCAWRGGCTALELPALYAGGPKPRFPLDLARVEGVTIVAVVMHDSVRVATSRDDGRTWAPWTIAFDAGAQTLAFDVRAPSRLLAVGHRVLLTGAASKTGQRYPVLASEDFGASWRTP